jgi:hypothetical protein
MIATHLQMLRPVVFPVSLLAWFAMHKLIPTFAPMALAAICPSATVRQFGLGLSKLPQAKKAYFCRLCRSELYYLWASIVGAVLLAKVRTVHDLLLLWSDEHQVFFSIGAASWTVACWEDYTGRRYLSDGAQIDEWGDNTNMDAWDDAMKLAFAFHHILTLFAYGFILHTGTLSSLGAIGRSAPTVCDYS